MSLLIYLLLILTPFQDDNPFEKFLEENSTMGPRVFLEKVYQNITYPLSARRKCRVGKLKVEMTIDEDGRPEWRYLNELGLGIEEDVTRVLRLTMNDWKEGETSRSFTFTIAYRLGDLMEISGDINLTGYHVGNSSLPSCGSNQDVLDELMEQFEKEKYKKARRLSEELLRRDPDSVHYLQLYDLITGKLAK